MLHLPAGFVPGQTYPTIVQVYSLIAYTLHQYAHPLGEGGGMSLDIPFWTGQGYVVLLPDIRPRPNHMKEAILEDVDAALDAASEFGIVDVSRLGLRGHSFGGYEVCVLVAPRTRFKATIALSPATEWVTRYGRMFGDKGYPGSLMGEGGFQPYLTRPWWSDWDSFRDNSPLFDAPHVSTPLLLIHGTEDPKVPFEHSQQFFHVLRHLGDKPAVLLEYPDEKHSISSRDSIRDATLRQLQFYDHYLKGKPAPAWWERSADERAARGEPPAGFPSHNLMVTNEAAKSLSLAKREMPNRAPAGSGYVSELR